MANTTSGETATASRRGRWLAVATAAMIALPLPISAARADRGPSPQDIGEGLVHALNQVLLLPEPYRFKTADLSDARLSGGDGSWRVTFDRLDLPDRAGKGHVGPLRGHVTEADQGVDVALTLPDRIAGDDGPVAEMQDGRLTYRWSPALKSLLASSFSAGKLTLSPASGPKGLRVGPIETASRVDAPDGGGYRLRQEGALENLSLDDGVSRITVGRARLQSQGMLKPGRDLALLDRAREFMSPNAALAMEGMNIYALTELVAAVAQSSGSVEIENLSLRTEGESFDIDGATITTDYIETDAENRLSALSLAYDYRGLRPTDFPPAAMPFMPARLAVDMWIDDAPLIAVIDEFAILKHAVDAGERDEVPGDEMARKIAELAQHYGSSLHLKEIHYDSDLLNVSGSGVAVADGQALQGFTGRLRVEVSGFDKAIQAVPTLFPGEQGPMAMLMMAQGLGRPTATADGRVVHVYDFELTGDGTILLNGQDMAPLLAMFETDAEDAQGAQ